MKVHSIFLCCWTSSILLLANFGVADAALLSSTTREEQVANTATNLRGADNLNENKKPKRGKLLDLDLYAEAINAIFYGNYTPAETKQIIDHVGRNFVRADVVDPEKTGLAFAFEKVPRKLRDISCVRGKGCECPDDTYVDCVCTLGYVSDGEGGCRDYDECANDAPCAPFELGGFCVDTDPDNTEFPMYKCGCDPNRGFQDGSVLDPVHGPLSCAAKDFVDTDECSTGEHDCDSENGICANDPLGTFICSCKENFDLSDGNKCTPVVESVEQPCGGKCDPANQFCDSSDGKCVCVQGFFAPSGRGGACQLILNCETANGGCDKNAVCADRETDILCTCRSGYGGNGLQCIENNECTNGVASCDANADCINFDGGFACVCQDGFQDASPLVDGTACTDVDECNLEADNCDTNASCTNTIGSFTCLCNSGFNGDGVSCAANIIESVVNVPSTGGSGGPVDPNQCTDNTNNCHPDAVCTNTNSGVGFTCVCEEGFIGDGIVSCRSTCSTPFSLVGNSCALLECTQTVSRAIGTGKASYAITFPVSAELESEATLTVLAQGEFDNDNEDVRVRPTSGTGNFLKTTTQVSKCPTIPQVAGSFTVTAVDFNKLIANGGVSFVLRPFRGISGTVNRKCNTNENGDQNNLVLALTTLRNIDYIKETDEVCVLKECLEDDDCGIEEFCVVGQGGTTTCQLSECNADTDCAVGEVCLRGNEDFLHRCYTPGVCDDANPVFEALTGNPSATQLVLDPDQIALSALLTGGSGAEGSFVEVPFDLDFFFIADGALRNLFVSSIGGVFILDSNNNVQGFIGVSIGGFEDGDFASRVYTLDKGDSFLISWENEKDGVGFQLELFPDGRFYYIWGPGPTITVGGPGPGQFLSFFASITDGAINPADAFTSVRLTEGSPFTLGFALTWPENNFRCFAESKFECLSDDDCGNDAFCVTEADLTTSCVQKVLCPPVAQDSTVFQPLAGTAATLVIADAARNAEASVSLPFFVALRALNDGGPLEMLPAGVVLTSGNAIVSADGSVTLDLSYGQPLPFPEVTARVAHNNNLSGGSIYTLDKGDSFLVSWEGFNFRNPPETSLDFQLEIFKDGRLYWIYGAGGELESTRSVRSSVVFGASGAPDGTDQTIFPVDFDNAIVVNENGVIRDWPGDLFFCQNLPIPFPL